MLGLKVFALSEDRLFYYYLLEFWLGESRSESLVFSYLKVCLLYEFRKSVFLKKIFVRLIFFP